MPSRLLFSPYSLGPTNLSNRVVMAPMTRCRVKPPFYAPTPMVSEYYAQRASAGLMISEGLVVSPQGRGYCNTPGLYSDRQEQAWKRVTRAVHRDGGRIFAQLWHCGRISHSSVLPDDSLPVGPGNIRAQCDTFGVAANGQAKLWPCAQPRVLETDEIHGIVGDFVDAARRAVAAEFDGVELHAANGYLLDQFRCPFLNQRADIYGGTLENRCRLMLETVGSVASTIGPQHVGVRLSPLGTANDMHPDPDPEATYGYLARRLDDLGIAYLHLNDQGASWTHDLHGGLLSSLRASFRRTLILCGGFDATSAEAALQARRADLIAFGKPYISNPDLVERLRRGYKLAAWNSETFYGSGASGYIDYPPHQVRNRARHEHESLTGREVAGHGIRDTKW